MNGNGRQSASLYEQTLEYARREIDEASAQISKLRERLSYLEARMEAAKSVYEAVAARLNVEDEIGEASHEEFEAHPVALPPPVVSREEFETHSAAPPPVVSREEISRLLQAQETVPRETPLPSSAPPVSPEPVVLSPAERDLLRRHLESRSAARNAPPEPAPAAAAPPKRGPAGGLSEEDRRLIEEHLRRRMEAERQNT